MNYLFITVVLLMVMLSGRVLSENAKQSHNSEKVVANAGEFVAEYVVSDKHKIPVRGRASFVFSRIQSDESIAGVMTVSLTEPSRSGIAEQVGKTLAETPEVLTFKNVLAFLKKDALCPKLSIYLDDKTLVFLGNKMVVDDFSFDIDLENNSEALRNLLCQWAKSIKAGSLHTYRLANQITTKLQGKSNDD